MALRDDLIHLAHDNPGEVQDALLPILARTQRKRAGIELPGMDVRSIAKLRQVVGADSYRLLREIYRTLQGRFDANDEAAMKRVRNSLQAGSSWDEPLHRNNIFKAANLLGLKLPHAMF